MGIERLVQPAPILFDRVDTAFENGSFPRAIRTPPKRDFPKHMREKTGVKNPYFETAPILF